MADYKFQMKNNANTHRVFVLIFFAVLASRLFFLQVIKHEQFRTISDKNRLRTHTLLAPRGLITDRNGNVLAENRPSYSIYLFDHDKSKLESTLNRICSLIPCKAESLINPVLDDLKSGMSIEGFRLFRDLRFSEVCVLKEHLPQLPGIGIEAEPVRYYRYPYSTSHLLGNMGEIGRNEWAELRKQGYAYRSLKGVSGIEFCCENRLRGKNGISFVEVDACGHRIGDFEGREAVDPVPGSSINLTIDIRLQVHAQRLLEGWEGAVVAVEPETGDVLALVSSPSYNGNLFSGGGITNKEWETLTLDPAQRLFNRGISSRYPPGSTYKLIVGLHALEEGWVQPTSNHISCTGKLRLGKRTFKCWKLTGHGPVDFFDAFERSCDVYYYNLGLRFDLDNLAEFSRYFCLGEKTGIELPGENGGLIPDIRWYDRKFGENNLTRGYFLNLSIGQGELLVTPLQMAAAFGTVANGGIYCPPRVIRKNESRAFDKVSLFERPSPVHLPITESNLDLMMECMRLVVESPGGTGHLAAVDGIVVGGKTGTAQNETELEHAWFVGVAPLGNPKISIAVIVEQAGHGGEVAAPIAGELIRRYLDQNIQDI